MGVPKDECKQFLYIYHECSNKLLNSVKTNESLLCDEVITLYKVCMILKKDQ